MTERAQRQAVIREAMTWEQTPFRWETCVKGWGVDCGRLIAASLNDSGVKRIDIASLPHMPADFFLHRDHGSFLDQIRRFAVEYALAPGQKPKPADIVVAEWGRDAAHAALVVDWPKVIGAANGSSVTVWKNIFESPQYGTRRLRFFDPWGSHD